MSNNKAMAILPLPMICKSLTLSGIVDDSYTLPDYRGDVTFTQFHDTNHIYISVAYITHKLCQL